MSGTTETTAPRLRLWEPLGMPQSWVVENMDTNEFHLLPLAPTPWESRVPYRGHREALRPVSGYCWLAIGAPLRRPWNEVCCDKSGCN